MSPNKDISTVDSTIQTEKADGKESALSLEDLHPIESTDPDFPVGEASVQVENALPLNVLPERRQALVLGWKVNTLRAVNEFTGIFVRLPTICAGTSGCPFGSICTVPNRDDFIGQSCPLEVLEIYKNFSGYVKDLNISPSDTTDLHLVVDLTRLHLEMWRSDMYMKLQPEVVSEAKVVDQKSGKVYFQSLVNTHRSKQANVRKSIHDTYKLLQASRADKASRADAQVQAAAIMSAVFSGKEIK